jgi:hypothetical protein
MYEFVFEFRKQENVREIKGKFGFFSDFFDFCGKNWKWKIFKGKIKVGRNFSITKISVIYFLSNENKIFHKHPDIFPPTELKKYKLCVPN